MADHLRRDCLSCYGDVKVATPHLDALSEESIIFDRAYCSTPLCVPTRISMYTGKWPHTNGVIVNGGGLEKELPFATLGPEHRTVYEALDAAGYSISHVGIHHCKSDPPVQERVPNARFNPGCTWTEHMAAKGVDSQSLYKGSVQETLRPTPNYHDGRVMVKHFSAPKAIARFPYPADDYMDGLWANQAAELIGELDPGPPQFVEVLFWAPHPPLIVPDPYWGMYPPENIELPETVGKWYDGQPGSLLLQTCGAMGAQLSREEWRPTWSAYLGLVTMVDGCIGKVIQALKARGIWDDALVVFTQDHGDNLGCHALTQKHCAYEEASHIPLLIKPPGGGNGRREQFVGHVDFADTVCDFAGAARLPGSQGRSLRPVMDDPATGWRDALFIEYNGDHGRSTPIRAIVADTAGSTYKYIYNHEDVEELYDLQADPLETVSLVTSTEHASVRRDLRGRLADWMSETGDFLEIATD